ncbi:DUF4397 domain-containing protein [Hymenobacter sp. IS2118]|uniref:DUF4397 domain-containing protein n=1 Tax=Hymenobacter sp. IS2118 TaxID=1505605 RepID=UPI0009DD5E77|nr:DUF4397 domain-containing protein [Hymenobacter sp. IS2118]
MSTSSLFRRTLQVLLPATLLLTACGKDDKPADPAPDKGKVLLSHAAAAANTPVTAFINDQQVGQLNFGQSTAYLSTNAGTQALRINSGTQSVATQVLTIAKDQNYTVFAYSPAATIGSIALLQVPDDLTAPPAGQVKVRLVHLAVGAPSPLRLSVPSPIPGSLGPDITTDVEFTKASAFTNLNAGAFNLSVTTVNTTPRAELLAVGDGTGAGTGTKTFEAGKIYTVVVRGISGGAVPAAQQPQAIIIQHN